MNNTKQITIGQRMTKVYNWMVLGLTTTSLSAYYFNSIELLKHMNSLYIILLVLSMFGLVIHIGARLEKMKYRTLVTNFILFSLTNGIFFSSLVGYYTSQSIFMTFLITAASFVGLSIYGTITKKDLTGIGTFCIMALFGIIVVSIINIFFLNIGWLYNLITISGILVFSGLTAYDTQKIKDTLSVSNEEESKRMYIFGALELYLDFLNLFLYLLRIFGERE